MKSLSVLAAVGVVIVLMAGTVFGSEHGQRDREKHEQGEHSRRDQAYERSGAYESKIYGTVEKLPNGFLGAWIVKGREVLVTKDTIIKEKHGKVSVGTYVEVEGNVSGKTFTARKIETKRGSGEHERSGAYESKIYGTVEKLPNGLLGTWIVRGMEVLVTKETAINEKHGKIGVGSYVEVEGSLSGKTFTAHEVETKRDKK